MDLKIPRRRLSWRPCYRIIPSRFPAIDLFERVARPEDLDAVIELESRTNDRIRNEIGELHLIAPEDRVAGPGSSVIMAAFTHLNPEGSRFSDGTWGVFYAARDLETAIAETRHHRELFMRATDQPRMELDMRAYLVDLNGGLHDIRPKRSRLRAVYGTNSYAASQRLARRLRSNGSDGIVYQSVRRGGGQCAAVFRPRLLSRCRQGTHLCYVWDGRRISRVYRKSEL